MPDARCARLLRAGVKKRRVEDPWLLQDKHTFPSGVTTIALVLTSPTDLSPLRRGYEAESL